MFKGISRLVLNKIKNIITQNNAILLHECSEFKDFDGRDVDAFYFSNKNLNTNCEDDVILYQRGAGSFRFLVNQKETTKFVNIDIDNIFMFSPNNLAFNKKNLNESTICHKTKLKHFSTVAIIYYKIFKYFSDGFVHSYEQLYRLKKLNSLNEKDLNNILNLTSNYMTKESVWLNKLVELDFENFKKNNQIKNF